MPGLSARSTAMALAVGVLFVFVAPARADSIPLCALGADGVTVLAQGNLSVSHLSSTEAIVQLQLKNTSPSAGAITGFGFCGPSNILANCNNFDARDSAGNKSGFGLLAGVNANLSLGSLLGLNVNLGAIIDKPNGGIGLNESGTFTFHLLGNNANDLSSTNLLGGIGLNIKLSLELSGACNQPIVCTPYPPIYCPPSPNDPCDGPPSNQPPASAVPAPPGLVLAGFGLGGLLLGHLRRKREAAVNK